LARKPIGGIICGGGGLAVYSAQDEIESLPESFPPARKK